MQSEEQVKPETAQQAMTVEIYNAVIERLVPLDVRLADLSFMVKSPVHSGPLSAHAEMQRPVLLDALITNSDGTQYAQIEHKAAFRISASDESIAAEGRATYIVRLRLEFAPPVEFWDIFLLRNVKLYTHPALRDLLSSLSTRASLVSLPLASVAVTQTLARPSQALEPSLPKPLPTKTD